MWARVGVTDGGHSVDTCWGHWCGSQCRYVLGSLVWITVWARVGVTGVDHSVGTCWGQNVGQVWVTVGITM